MAVKLRKTYSGPFGGGPAGTTLSLPEAIEAALVEGGDADPVIDVEITKTTVEPGQPGWGELEPKDPSDDATDPNWNGPNPLTDDSTVTPPALTDERITDSVGPLSSTSVAPEGDLTLVGGSAQPPDDSTPSTSAAELPASPSGPAAGSSAKSPPADPPAGGRGKLKLPTKKE